ncbi:MAG TPA: universal stress protein [Bacteroidia bacterium]|nr:universal stress protein [Bacteroidia bacterium]HNT80338.1 universal stress protein [Bacteroidia bacterium]
MSKPLSIKKILIPFDFSETAALSLEHAVFLAKLLKAEITLLHVVETLTFTSAISHALSGFEKKIEDSSNEQLKALAEKIHMETSIEVSIRTEVGRIYKIISSIAKEEDTNLIIMGTHGVSGYQRFNLGSNTSRVVETAPCPVLSVQTHASKIGFKKILLPIDDTASSRQKVPQCVSLANIYNAQIHIAGLVNFSNEEQKRKFRIKLDQVEEYLVQHEIKYETSLIYGDDLAKMTLNVAEEKDCDLLIIMTEQEPLLSGLFLGTYASKVVNHSKIPVLSIKPDEVDPEKISVSL